MLLSIFQKYKERVLKNDPIYMKWKESGGKSYTEMCEPTNDNIGKVEHEEVVIAEDSTKTVPTDSVETNSCEGEDASKKKNITSPVKASDQNTEVREKQCNSSKSNIENDCFNGGKTDKYCWSQTISDIELKVPIPSCFKSKDFSIDIQSHTINVSLKKDPPPASGLESKVILTGKLKEKIKCDESLWSLVPGQHIEINLEKFEQKWWDCVFEGDVEIDRTQIDTTQHVHDFDEQTQSDIRKVMYDQQQKLLGKPTSEEQKTHAMLEKAWDAEGSPFKGTPFDPSVVNIASGSGT